MIQISRSTVNPSTVGQALLAILLAVPLLAYSRLHFQRPPRVDQTKVLFEGITYQRTVQSTPRPLVIHTVTVKLQTPGLEIVVTAGNPETDDHEFQSQTVSDFLQTSQTHLAINASFFYPFMEETPWRYFPRSGDRVNALGQVISSGQPISPPQSKWPVFCLGANQQAQILLSEQCPEETAQAVAGSHVLVTEGRSTLARSNAQNPKAYARVAVGLNAQTDTLWLVVVDGKQPFYSEGITESELADIFVALGAETALNLDGGGSTTLVMATPQGPQVLNAPIHTKLPMRERPVANHLGIYVRSSKGKR